MRTKVRFEQMSKNFTFVLIPTGKDALQELTRSKAGGLEKDELQIHAKKYFASSDDGKVHANVLIFPTCDPWTCEPE